MTKKLTLSEAAAEVFSANIAGKQRQGDAFGLGKKLNPAGLAGPSEVDLGHAIDQSTDGSTDYTRNVPRATPPGATPPVGSEPMKRLAADTDKQSLGRRDLGSEEEEPDALDNIRDRKSGKKPTQSMMKNPGAVWHDEETDQGDSVITEEDFDLSDDVDALLAGENLSEEFKNKATTIFEAAVAHRVQAISQRIEESMNEQFDDAVEQVKEELAARVDDYLNYMVQEWITENEIAIETGLRAEIVENFIDGLKNLFVEHYIDIPEEKVDIVGELADKVTELEDELNEQINCSIQLTKELNEHKKTEAIYAVCEGLTQTQVEKIVALAEGVDFTTESAFERKLEILKESYFPSDIRVADKHQFLNETMHGEEEPVHAKSADPEIAIYAETISKTLHK